MKNLSNCKPSEFLTQTNKIRKSVENWLTVTDIQGIRKHKPVFTSDMSDEDKKKATEEQAQKNIRDMLDSIMEKHPNETLELLALMCFVEPEHVDDYSVSEYLGSFNELLNDKNVMGFIRSLMELGQTVG